MHELVGLWWWSDGSDRVCLSLSVASGAARVWTRWLSGDGDVAAGALSVSLDGVAAAVPGDLRLTAAVDAAALVTTLAGPQGVIATTRYARDGEQLVVTTEAPGAPPETRCFDAVRPKQVLVYRRDLTMRKGKIAAQCAHGALLAVLAGRVVTDGQLGVPVDGPTAVWLARGSAKIVLSVEGEAELLAIAAAAKAAGLPHALVTDAGKTEFKGVPTRTVVAIGPAAGPEIDAITGPGGLVPTKLA